MTLTSQPPPIAPPRVPETAPSITLVVALGPSTDASVVAATIAHLGAGVDAVFVDDATNDATRTAAAALAGPTRVLHHPHARGTRAALAAGVACAGGNVVALVGDPAALDGASLALARVAFADPGLGLLEILAASDGLAAAVFLRRSALASIADRATLSDPHRQRGAAEEAVAPLLRDSLTAALSAARWRTLRVHADHAVRGGIVTWPDTTPASYPDIAKRWSPPRQRKELRPGMNVIGLLEAACGIGDAGRLYVEALEAAGVPLATFSWHGHNSPPAPFRHRGDGVQSFDTNLFALNADVMQMLAPIAGVETFARRHNIGLWFWEVEELHTRLLPALPLVHELWAATNFLAEVFARTTDKVVTHIPLPVPYRAGPPALSRVATALPDAFTFLVVFDYKSLERRKNALGAIAAFTRAFAPGEGPVLVIKTSSAESDPAGAKALRRAMGERRDILLLDGQVSDEVIDAMIGNADCLVSLHRAEGFGLCLATAMSFAVPVIATAYSGNLDFMTPDNSFLVPHGWSHVPDALAQIYPARTRWAEPDLDAAAAAMRSVYLERSTARARAERGREDIRRTNSTAAAAAAITARLAELRGGGAR